jgi:hypothetical protein
MDRPQGMSEIEFDRAKRQGHYNQGHDEEEPDRGPDHPVSKTARDVRAEMRRRGIGADHPDTTAAVKEAVRAVEGGEHPDEATARATEKHKGPAGGRHAGGGDE